MKFKLCVAAMLLALPAVGWCADPVDSTASAPAATNSPPPAARPVVKPPIPFAKAIRGELDACMTGLSTDGDFAKARQQLTGIFEQVIAGDPVSDPGLITDVEFNRRLVGQLAQVNKADRADLLKYLRSDDVLARTMAFAIDYDPDAAAATAADAPDGGGSFLSGERSDAAEVYETLETLRKARPEQVAKYPNLAAAIAIDYKRPFRHIANENHGDSNPPLVAFDYYVKNEAHMFFGIKGVPAELLLWMVDTTTPPDDLAWALNKYAGDRNVGSLFFDIKYDYAFFEKGTEKALTKNGFSLPNILKYGGVCVDQAYFASEVGKAIGVPTAVAEAESGEAGHAWVGFLELAQDGRSARWNFDSGRYPEFRAIRGNVEDPQTRRIIPDAVVSMTAEMIGSKAADRDAAESLTDATRHLLNLEAQHTALTPAALPADAPIIPSTHLAKPRQANSQAEAQLVELGLRRFPGYVPGWLCVSDLAEAGKFTLDQKRRWSEILIKFCGNKYPDFTLRVLEPMIATVDDTTAQNAMWNTLFDMFRGRSDLDAQVRLAQSDMWEKAGDANKAGICCEDIITRFANDGPFIFAALRRTEQLLRETNRADKVLQLYETTWKNITPPGDMYGPLKLSSNWYNVGKMYAYQLEEAGQTDKAQAVLTQLDGAVSASGK